MEQHICIHGHFYQPPRENPWLEAIERQDSAFPYHDWNERITDECYRRNTRSRILDDTGQIIKIVNNYSRMSFNFGPTLHSWLAAHAPDVSEAIQEADRQSIKRFNGHGSAMAQAYNHMILPLANERDRRTQVVWGIRDFEHRFGRPPEGMWLPETAANRATLETLAEHGMRFAVLAPRQAGRTRSRRGGRWRELHGGIDPSRAYEMRLPSGRSIALFFYDGPISQAVAFEGLLNSGQTFAKRLLGGFDDQRTWPQLMHVATDGETYGHHHRHGDMALAAALDHIDLADGVSLTNYGAYLEQHPPMALVEIIDDSSWSCAHGVDRWKNDCGCHSGVHPEWNQRWRAPLRESLDWLRDTVASQYEQAMSSLLNDAWAARDRYIEVILDRSPGSLDRFFATFTDRPLTDGERVRALKLLELQRHSMLMYTSCGWFFDDLSGIETVQVVQYAGRVLQLARDLFEDDPTDEYLQRVERAVSNVPTEGTGRDVFDRYVRPALVDLPKVGAHFALDSLFEPYGRHSTIYCYDVELEDSHQLSTGRARLHMGRARMTSRVTLETEHQSFAALYLGDHVMTGAVRPFQGEEPYHELIEKTASVFNRADFTELLRLMDSSFGGSHYSLGTLFRDEQRKVLDLVLQSTLSQVEATYENIYHSNAPLLRFLGGLDTPAPRALLLPAEFIFNARLRRALEADPVDLPRMQQLLTEAVDQSLSFDEPELAFAAGRALDLMASQLTERPRDVELLDRLRQLMELIRNLPFRVGLAQVQDALYESLRPLWPELSAAAEDGHEPAAQWTGLVRQLGELLAVRVP